jgi:murein L,D-transpeptidase YcbB/YkuD
VLLGTGAVAVAAPASASQPWCEYAGQNSVYQGNVLSTFEQPMTIQVGATRAYDCFLRTTYGGDGVRSLQQTLNDCYSTATGLPGSVHLFSPLVVDGSFGANTKAAVIKVQQHEGIGADGIYGTQTRQHLLWHATSSGGYQMCFRSGI